METIKTTNDGGNEAIKFAERAQFVEKIYRLALEEHEKFKELPEADLKAVISKAIEETEDLENAADLGRAGVIGALTPEVAGKITALWDFSGPGTYDDPVKEDRYKSKEWAQGMDHARLDYTAWLSRKISEVVSGEELRGSIGEVPKIIERTKEVIAKSGPVIMYNGTDVENSVVKDVVTREGIIIPEEKLMVVGEGINGTVDQVKSFRLPEELHKPGGEIGLISHAPHLMRIIHTLSRYEPLPKDMTVRLFPVSTPDEGKEEYAIMEIKGLLYYVFLAGDASAEAYPCVIHGKESPK